MQHTMIVSSNRRTTIREDAIVVATPLDAIVGLEKLQRIKTVVLAGAYATDRALEAFLGEFYPSVQIDREL